MSSLTPVRVNNSFVNLKPLSEPWDAVRWAIRSCDPPRSTYRAALAQAIRSLNGYKRTQCERRCTTRRDRRMGQSASRGQLSANEAGGDQSDSAADAIVNDASPVDASVDATVQDGALGDTGVGDGPAAEDSGIVPGDAGTNPTCSAHFLLSQSFASSATVNVQVPDCAQVHGTVTTSTLPSGATFVQGTVAAYLKSVSIDGGRPDSADAWSSDSVVQTAPNQFAYAMALPSGTDYIHDVYVPRSLCGRWRQCTHSPAYRLRHDHAVRRYDSQRDGRSIWGDRDGKRHGRYRFEYD